MESRVTHDRKSPFLVNTEEEVQQARRFMSVLQPQRHASSRRSHFRGAHGFVWGVIHRVRAPFFLEEF